MCGTVTHPCLCEHNEQASRRFLFLYAISSSDQICLASGECIRKYRRRALRKYFRSIIIKIPEISVGSQMERFVSVCSNWNIRNHLLICRTGWTENYLSILRNQLISRFPSVDFSFIGNWGKE